MVFNLLLRDLNRILLLGSEGLILSARAKAGISLYIFQAVGLGGKITVFGVEIGHCFKKTINDSVSG